MALWTRRQVLAQAAIAAAAVHTLDPHELCCAPSAFAQTADKDLFELKKVGDGVYAAIAAARYKVNSNAAVIVTDDGVVVVDSHSKPSAARAVYKEIQAVTNKPVRKIINTHFHWDHWQGNEVYAGAEVIASQQTKENLTNPNAGVGGVPFIEKQIAALPKEIDGLKEQVQKASDPAIKRNLESNLQQAEAYLQELKSLKPALPTRTVATKATLTERGREIQLHVLGRGHTNGEVATKAHLTFFRGYLADLVDAVKKGAAGGASLDDLKQSVANQLAPKYEAGMSKYPLGRYRDRVATNIEAVYNKSVKKG